mmetsp:Transcript_49608/g.114989  ORF Transcript_49608/g.114989 Transcript_49608/m.114989 type:complete len:256 (-) Transcript_49608:58-825(-)
MAEDLGRKVLGVLGPQCPLRVNVLDGALDLLPRRVAHAKERRVGDEAEATLLVDLGFLRKGVHGEHAEALAAGGVVADLLQDLQVEQQHRVLRLVDVLDAVAGRRVDAHCKDDEIPRVHADQILDVFLGVLVHSLGLHVLDADAAGWGLLQDLLAVPVAVGEDKDVLLRRGRGVHLGPLAQGLQRVGHGPEIELDRVARGALDGQVLREPLHWPAHAPAHLRGLFSQEPLVGTSYRRGLLANHGQDSAVSIVHGC